ncbi:LytTR family DNA-binding domain-containing protein [Sedimentitalea sp. HM32M-2]|uniref:LytTR family DNA-binding domain-containing protein n=1 Tax=Sedimentitalea sp. HM32M-2 TaxID=3351566 RepID=UPI0036459521
MIKAIARSYRPLFTWRTLTILALTSIVAAAAGPFGTYETTPFWLRLLYWTAVVGISVIIGHGCHAVARHLVPAHRPILTDLLMTALMVPLFTPVLWGLSHFLLHRAAGSGPSLYKLFYYVATITAAICVCRRILPGFETVGYFGTQPITQDVPAPPRLTRRLSPDFEGPILRLTVRDHFVDVVAAAGIETIRLRFADAIDEMDTVIGHCTHRSHWVVQDAIEGSEREKGKIFVRLVNGDRVPVSRKYRPALEEAGLI